MASIAAIAPQADQQTTSRILAFMATLNKAKAEWGISHMFLAQAALRRPILLAQPMASRPYWHMEPITHIVARCVSAAGVKLSMRMLQTPSGEPLRLLPTRMNEVRMPLASISHSDPLLPVSDEQMREDVHDYSALQRDVALGWEKSRAEWQAMLQVDASIYGGTGQREACLDAELAAMRDRSDAWGEQAGTLRRFMGFEPTRVDADGACGLSSLSVAAGGTASHDEKESLRTEVLSAAPQFLRDVGFQKLLLLLEGEPAHLEASATLTTSPDAPQVEMPSPVAEVEAPKHAVAANPQAARKSTCCLDQSQAESDPAIAAERAHPGFQWSGDRKRAPRESSDGSAKPQSPIQ